MQWLRTFYVTEHLTLLSCVLGDTCAHISVYSKWGNNLNSTSLLHWIKLRSDAVWSSGHQPNLSPDPSPAYTQKPTPNPAGHRSARPGPGHHQSKAGYGGTPPDTTAPHDLQFSWTCRENMLELRCEGSHASADSSWSCNPAAAVQTVTAETQVCRPTCDTVM